MSLTSRKDASPPPKMLTLGHGPVTTSPVTVAAGKPSGLPDADEQQPLLGHSPPVSSAAQTVAIIACITWTTLISSFLNGMVTVALPMIAKDLGLDPSLVLWCVKSQLRASARSGVVC